MLNTNLKLLVVSTLNIRNVVTQIAKGNYLSYLDHKAFDSYEAIAIYGSLLTKIQDFDTMVKYLNTYLTVAENWAHCDLLTFDINEDNKQKFLNLAQEYITSPHTFVRRTALIILLQMLKDKSILPLVFKTLNSLKKEDEYYVNMAGGWLLAECYIKHPVETTEFFKNNQANKKLVNKGIQKCRESLRLPQETKDALLVYKK